MGWISELPVPQPVEIPVLEQWLYAAAKAKAWKEKENELRAKLVTNHFRADLEEGSEKVVLSDNTDLVAIKKLNYTLDQSALPVIANMLPAKVFDAVFKPTRKLSVSEFKKLNEDYKRIASQAITTKAGMPSLKIETRPFAVEG